MFVCLFVLQKKIIKKGNKAIENILLTIKKEPV